MTTKEQAQAALDRLSKRDVVNISHYPLEVKREIETIRAALEVMAEDKEYKKYKRGDYVRKRGDKGQWHGVICGTYSTECTPEGYAVESVYEKNSVQIYPESALEPWQPKGKDDDN